MPFLAKMTAHLRSALSLKDSKPYSSANNDYYNSSHREQHYYNTDYFASSKRNQQKTCYRNGECNDADWLYFRSKEQFASWDIKDLADQPEIRTNERRSPPRRIDRVSPQEDVDVEVEEIFVNSDTTLPRKSRSRSDSRNYSSEEDNYEEFFRRKNEKNCNDVVESRKNEDRKVEKYSDERNGDLNGYDKSRNGVRHYREMRSEKFVQVEEYRTGVKSTKSPVDEKYERRIKDSDKRKSYAGREEIDSKMIEKRERESRTGSLKNRSIKENNGQYRPRDVDDVIKKSNYVEKERRTRRDEVSTLSDRHSRPLTPPQDHRVSMSKMEETKMSSIDRRTYVSKNDKIINNNNLEHRTVNKIDEKRIKINKEEEEAKKNLLIDSLCESNRRFAANYLKEHSKVKELYTNKNVSTTEEFVNSTNSEDTKSSSPKNEKSVKIYRVDSDGKKRVIEMKKNTQEINQRNVFQLESEEEEKERKETQRIQDTTETINEKKTIEENESYNEKTFITPSRKRWIYRDEGVHITDIDEGQPCLNCNDACSGFAPHTWRKNCTSCKCPREAHDVCHDEWVSVRARLGLKADESRESIAFDPRDAGLAWAPPGLPLHKVEEYFSMLPELSVPRLGTPGERYRDRQLATQLPKQDLARAYCRHLDSQHSVSAGDFMSARNEIALDIGSVQEVFEKGVDCGVCNKPLKYGSLAVSASKLGQLCHPTCFRCTQCEELLVDLAYCVHDDALYCERHYAEQLKPRCAACDELIFSGEYTKAMNKDWHSGHFCCWQCDESLTGQRYVLRDEHPYCIKCYESVFANGCEECHKIIGIDSKDLSYKDKHWHEACFLCSRCRASLVDKQFGSKVDKIYCGNCYDSQFASRCDGCGEIFRAGTKKMEYKTRQWHEKCFCCVVCKTPIGTKSFIPREQEIYCAGCYEDKFATRCVKCNKIITSGGVTYKNEPWHRDCFTCTHCNQSLAGQRFTSRDEKPYCAECFGELFAKRCTSCSKPITGIGGTRFISFEDRHWHNDCFICAGCKTSLVGRGFITDGDDIICPECAKQKLS